MIEKINTLEKIKDMGNLEEIKEITFDLYNDTNPSTKAASFLQAEEVIVKYIMKLIYPKSIISDKETEIWIYNDGIYIPNGMSYIKNIVSLILENKYNNSRAQKIIDKIHVRTFIDKEDFFENKNTELLPVKNGILNIKTLELSDFTPEFIVFSKLNYNYNPDAKCPNIEEHLKNVLSSKKDVMMFQEAIGNCLFREYKYQVSTLLLGSGENGKSVTLELIRKLLGHKNTSSLNLQMITKGAFHLEGLHGKLANIAGDISSLGIADSQIFKDITGEGYIRADRKNKSPIEFMNYAKLFFACNQIPPTTDTTDGFFRRWLIFDFPYTFISKENIDMNNSKYKLKDNDITERIYTDDEMEGFLIYALEGFKRLSEQKDFTSSPSVDKIRKKYLYSSEPIRQYIDENLTRDFKGYVSKEEFRNRVYDFYNNNNISNSISDNDIFRILTCDYGVVAKKKMVDGDSSYVWAGIRFNEVEF